MAVTTMQDVANRSGVSAKTVSRVFNDDPHVTDETRARVREAMRELNYVPNMLARTFRAGRAAVIGIAVPDIGDPFFAGIIRAIDTEAQKREMAIVVTSLGEDPSRERATIEALLKRQVEGLIIAPISDDHSYLSRWLEHVPTIFIDREPIGIVTDSFVEDDQGAAWNATTHLLQLGHRRISFLGDEFWITSRLRLAGYKQALTDFGVEIDDTLIAVDSTENYEAHVPELLALPDPPTAIFSSNARASLVVFPALQRLGRTDVALVSFGDFPMAASLQPSVTVIDQDVHRMGVAAVGRLFERLDDSQKRLKRKNVFPVDLVVRSSSTPGPFA